MVITNLKYSSYLVLPYGDSNAKPMNSSIKKKVKWTRLVQLILRCIELLGAIGLLATMTLMTGIDTLTAWLMRIPVSRKRTISRIILDHRLTLCSPVLAYSIRFTEYIIWVDALQGGHLLPPRLICYLPPVSMSLLSRSMPTVPLWPRRNTSYP